MTSCGISTRRSPVRRPDVRAALGALLLAAACAWAGAAAGAEYTVVIQGETAGRLRVNPGPDGSVETDHSYRDNGRGPDLRERWTPGPGGLPQRYDGQGRSTYGAEIREQFTIDGGRVRWQSPADQGDEPAPPGFAFLPLEASPAFHGALAAALLASPGGSLPTFAGLRLQAEIGARLTLETPEGPLKLALAVVTGADEQPWYLWVRDDGSHAFFGLTWPGWSVIAKGHEAAAPALVERQLQAVDERLAALRTRLGHPFDGLTVIRAVRWFDAPAARMRGPSDVWLFDGRIGAVTAPDALVARADREIDGAGRTLIPGLWDLHAHMWPGSGLSHLAAGVTGVRDPGNDNASLARVMARAGRGEIVAPTIVPAGFIEGRSPFSSRLGFVVDSVQAGRDAIDWYAARGYRSIKLYNSIKPEWVKPLAAHAHARGLKVSGHVPAFMRAAEAVRDGYDELTHINQVMLNFVVRPGDDTRTLTRFERVGEGARRLDLKGREARAFLDLLRRRGTVVDPTLHTFEAMFTQAQGQPHPSLADVEDHLPVLWRRHIRSAEMDLRGRRLTDFRESFQRLLDLTAALHREGLTLVAGTDGWEGIGLQRELALYVKAGIPAAEALRIGTWNGARVAGEGDRRGRIERGYVADLVLVEGDPAQRITDLRRASLVVQGRVAYRPAEIHEALGWKPFVPGAAWRDMPAEPAPR